MFQCSGFGPTYTKIGTIQRRLAWPLRKDDTQNREAFQTFSKICGSHIRVRPRRTDTFNVMSSRTHLNARCLLLIWPVKIVQSTIRDRKTDQRWMGPDTGFGNSAIFVLWRASVPHLSTKSPLID